MAKQFNDLQQKLMIITERESTLMRAVHILKPCYCVSIREKLQVMIYSSTSKRKVLIRDRFTQQGAQGQKLSLDPFWSPIPPTVCALPLGNPTHGSLHETASLYFAFSPRNQLVLLFLEN